MKSCSVCKHLSFAHTGRGWCYICAKACVDVEFNQYASACIARKDWATWEHELLDVDGRPYQDWLTLA